MSPPQQLRQQTSNCSLLLIYRPRKDGRLSWPGWLTSGWFTHISGHPSATGRAQDSESTSAKDRCSTAGPRNRELKLRRVQWCVVIATCSLLRCRRNARRPRGCSKANKVNSWRVTLANEPRRLYLAQQLLNVLQPVRQDRRRRPPDPTLTPSRYMLQLHVIV